MLKCLWDERVFREETAALRAFSESTPALVVCSDFSGPERVIATLVEARRRGELVALYPFLRDPAETLAEKVTGAIANSNDAQRFAQMSALRENRLHVNDRPLLESAVYHEPQLRAAVLAAKLADVLLFFTAAEKRRWSTLIKKPIRRFQYLPVPAIPFDGPKTGRITVFAPDAGFTQLAFVAMALQERRMSADFITAESPGAPVTGSTVIVPAWWRPARVAALAACGYSVVTPDAGGADERAACRTYAALDAFALGAAVDAAQSGNETGLRFEIAAGASALSEAAAPQIAGSRVSVIVRTYDRPQLLARAIRSIAAQTHADVEIVLVNNGGPDVRAILEASCGARACRYVVLDRREKISVASNAGIRAASGAYIAYLDDDDLLYPDHLSRALDALQRSGADVAYTNCLAEYARVDREERTVFGYQIFRDNEFVPKDMYVDNVAPIHSIVHRKDVVEKYGYFDESLPVTDDWEMWLKISRGARFIHVDRVTCEYSWRVDPEHGNMTLTHQRDFAESYQTITARYAADVEGLASVRTRQEQIIDARLRQAGELPHVDPRRVAELTIETMARDAVPAEPVTDPFA